MNKNLSLLILSAVTSFHASASSCYIGAPEGSHWIDVNKNFYPVLHLSKSNKDYQFEIDFPENRILQPNNFSISVDFDEPINYSQRMKISYSVTPSKTITLVQQVPMGSQYFTIKMDKHNEFFEPIYNQLENGKISLSIARTYSGNVIKISKLYLSVCGISNS